jgi:uncharacterized lipoprotein YmbA
MNGCSSVPTTKTSRYLLNNPQDIVNRSINTSVLEVLNPIVVIAVKELPQYLNQPNLVLQLASHQLHYAHAHVWAEPLKEGLSKALLSDLNSHSKKFDFIDEGNDLGIESEARLQLEVDYFHADQDAQVILSGRYWLTFSDKNNQAIRQKYTLKTSLETDGYLHSVEKMRSLVKQLALKIAKDIDLIQEQK